MFDQQLNIHILFMLKWVGITCDKIMLISHLLVSSVNAMLKFYSRVLINLILLSIFFGVIYKINFPDFECLA